MRLSRGEYHCGSELFFYVFGMRLYRDLIEMYGLGLIMHVAAITALDLAGYARGMALCGQSL